MQNSLACWVISLNRGAENTQRLLADLEQQGLAPEIFPAVDGRRAMPVLQEDEYFRNAFAMVRHGKLLTTGEVGCYLSHLRAVKKAYREGCKFVCLLEDDVVIEPGFAEVLNALVEENLDMVRLMSLKIRRRKVLKPLYGEHQLVRPERGGLGTQAYLMNRAGMRKFLDHARAIYEPIDKVFDHFWLFDLSVYAVEPHVAYELVHDSSIAKQGRPGQKGPNLWQRLVHHPVKLFFSLRRHAYLRRYRSELYPTEMPAEKPGKSVRLRGKKR
jgi:glycosyl transferase, family 25